eukprot:scaffold3166_cov399-Prasinococcus_capsulatus_cf.AAC.7
MADAEAEDQKGGREHQIVHERQAGVTLPHLLQYEARVQEGVGKLQQEQTQHELRRILSRSHNRSPSRGYAPVAKHKHVTSRARTYRSFEDPVAQAKQREDVVDARLRVDLHWVEEAAEEVVDEVSRAHQHGEGLHPRSKKSTITRQQATPQGQRGCCASASWVGGRCTCSGVLGPPRPLKGSLRSRARLHSTIDTTACTTDTMRLHRSCDLLHKVRRKSPKTPAHASEYSPRLCASDIIAAVVEVVMVTSSGRSPVATARLGVGTKLQELCVALAASPPPLIKARAPHAHGRLCAATAAAGQEPHVVAHRK